MLSRIPKTKRLKRPQKLAKAHRVQRAKVLTSGPLLFRLDGPLPAFGAASTVWGHLECDGNVHLWCGWKWQGLKNRTFEHFFDDFGANVLLHQAKGEETLERQQKEETHKQLLQQKGRKQERMRRKGLKLRQKLAKAQRECVYNCGAIMASAQESLIGHCGLCFWWWWQLHKA